MLSFDKIFIEKEGLQKEATISLAQGSVESLVLNALSSQQVSTTPEDISKSTGIDKDTITNVLNSFYRSGLVYEEQDRYFSLTQYGKELAQNYSSRTQEPLVSYVVPASGSKKLLQAFTANQGFLNDGFVNTLSPALKKTLNSLIQSGYVQRTSDGYALTTFGLTYHNHNRRVAKPLDDEIKEVYAYIKTIHPEYAYLYQLLDSDETRMNSFLNDVKNYVSGTEIKGGIFPKRVESEATVKKFWGSDTIPPHTSIEAAIFKEFKMMREFLSYVKSNFPTMKDIKSSRTYLSSLTDILTPEKISAQIREAYSIGAVLTKSDILQIAENIIQKPLPPAIDKSVVDSQILQLMHERHDIQLGVFFENDPPASISPMISAFLQNQDNGIEAFNLFKKSTYDQKAQVFSRVFTSGTDFSNKDWHDIDLANLSFNSLDFQSTNFNAASLSHAEFNGCNFQNATFVGADCDSISFKKCNLDSADFNNAVDLGKGTFENNTGTPRNFVALSATLTPEIREEVGNMDMQQHYVTKISPEEQDVAKVLIDGIRAHLYKVSVLRRQQSKLGALKFSDDNAISDDEKRSAIMNLLSDPTNIPTWLTSESLVQMVRSGETKRLGIDPRMNGKLIGVLKEHERSKAEQESAGKEKSRYEELSEDYTPNKNRQMLSDFQSKLFGVLNSYGNSPIPKEEILSTIPESAIEIKSLINTYRDKLTRHDLEQLSLQLSHTMYNISNDASSKITDFKETKINNFSYTSRISLFKHGQFGDRGTMHGDYPNSFAVILEPSSVGVKDPDVKKMIDSLTIHKVWYKGERAPGSGHYQHDVGATRIQPHVVTEVDLLQNKKTKKEVWVIVEIQSDPLQKPYDLGKALFPSWSPPSSEMTLNSEYHQVLSAIATMSGNSSKNSVPQQSLIDWAMNDPYFSNKGLADFWDNLTSTAIDYSKNIGTVLKMFLSNPSIPAVVFYPLSKKVQKNQNKSYPTLPYGKEVVDALLASHRIEPLYDENSDVPTFVSANNVSFNKFKVSNPEEFKDLYTSGVTDSLKSVLQALYSDNILKKDAQNISLSEYGVKTATVYNALSKFRKHYKNWEEMLIAEAMNRAIERGSVNELWVVSAKEYDEQYQGAQADHYDKPAQKFTDKKINAPFEIHDSGSTLYNSHPKQYYVINLDDWKSPQKTSALKFVASAFTNFVRNYVNKVISKYPYMQLVPQEYLIESAVQYLKSSGQVQEERIPEMLQDVNDEFHVGLPLGQVYTNYVTVLVTGFHNVKKNLMKLVKTTGEEPKKLCNEIFNAYMTQYSQQKGPINEEALHSLFNTILDQQLPHMFAEESNFYNEIQEGKQTTDMQGGELVDPHGEVIPPGQQEDPMLKPKEEGISFEAPNRREMKNMLQAEIDNLLDKLQTTTDETEKMRIKKRLHELSTLATLKFDPDDILKFGDILDTEPPNDPEAKVLPGTTWLLKDRQVPSVFTVIRVIGVFADGEVEYESIVDVINGTMGSMMMSDFLKKYQPNPPLQASFKFGDISVLSSEDEEFNTNRERNQWFYYEPANQGNDVAPVGGGSNGIGDKFDNSSRDMHGGFYTDLSLPDLQRKEKERETLDWTGRENLQLGLYAGLNFEFEQFLSTVLPSIKSIPKYAKMNETQLRQTLFAEWKMGKDHKII